MHIEKSVKTQVEIKPVYVISPVDEMLNRLSGVNNARAIISWLAENDDEPEADNEPSSARYTAIKGL